MNGITLTILKVCGSVLTGLILMTMTFLIGRSSVSGDLSVIKQRLVAVETSQLHIITQQTNIQLKIDRLLERP